MFSISGQSTLKAAAATAASQSISTKTNINNTITESGQQKNVAVSGNTVYVVWYDFTPGNGEIFFRKSNAGRINLSINSGNSWYPQIAVP